MAHRVEAKRHILSFQSPLILEATINALDSNINRDIRRVGIKIHSIPLGITAGMGQAKIPFVWLCQVLRRVFSDLPT